MERPSEFDPRLESLRGVAAFAVVVTHSVAIFRIDGSTSFWTLPFSQHTPATLLLEFITALFNAGSAVVVFFVLSGYVLTLSLRRSTGGLAAYTVRRAFRLLPPMWASIILMWAMLSVIQQPNAQSYSIWFSSVFRPSSTLELLSNAVLWSFKTNAVTWTMYVEVIGSALVPISVWASERYGSPALYLMLAVFASLAVLLYPSTTVSYLLCFHAGVMLATNSSRLFSRPRMLALAGLCVFIADRLVIVPSAWSILVNTCGAVLVIVGVINGAAESFMRHQFTRNVGRVSYSLYLFHLMAIYLIGILIGDIFESELLATFIAAVIIFPFSLAIAYIGYIIFEYPSIRAGREVGRVVSSHAAALEGR